MEGGREGGTGGGWGRDWGMMGSLPDSSISAPSRCARQQSQGAGRDSASSTSLAVRAAHGHIAKRRSWRVWWPTSRQKKKSSRLTDNLGKLLEIGRSFSTFYASVFCSRGVQGGLRTADTREKSLGRSVKHSCGFKWYCKFEQQSTVTLLKHHSITSQITGVKTIL